ncbi:glycosyltransferase [Algibacter pectinivorans]|uniref:Glycosyltransferase involved in cell wall bisynthesis n=1 Tax=Algibacter pectinivorans TaxID=870482 RepID=A0A1I1NZA7_9FLAO|nr:glycosyltransferase [Algibacter pectinivorans]SFD02662.1 Glycosyltransferase involved in cell wall bisynthesis [Algibacter pectinivorans]
MKILFVSMPSLHFFRWAEQLENSGHDVYWFDIVDGKQTNRLPWVKKINSWKIKWPKFKGRYFIKQKTPFLYRLLRPLIERRPEVAFEKLIIDLKPDLVHSFAMQVACVPIIHVMEKHPNQKWIYSSWGSDLFHLKSVKLKEEQVIRVLKRVNYFMSDCLRDYQIAKKYNFEGIYLGCFPGGGGYDFNTINKYSVMPAASRRTILVKGYQGSLGRCIQVLKALKNICDNVTQYKIIVFSADSEVMRFSNALKQETNLNISVLDKDKFLPQQEILKLMGKSIIYIGSSVSDGMPNTLLEAIIMGAFPIQSNPGGASAEVIIDNKNGLLIENPESTNEIQNLILKALKNDALIEQAFNFNQNEIKPMYEYETIKNQVFKAYRDAGTKNMGNE